MENKLQTLQQPEDESKLRAFIELTLLTIARTIGIRNPPAIEVLTECSAFILTYFKDYAREVSAIKLAFDYAVANGVEHYGNMDKTFIARALNIYKPVMRIKNARLQQTVEGYRRLLPHEDSNDESYYISLLDYIHKHKDFPMAWDWSKVHAHMDEVGMFDDEYDAEGNEIEEIKMYWYRESLKLIAAEKADIHLHANKSVDAIIINNMLENINQSSVRGRILKQKIKSKIYDEKTSDIKTGVAYARKDA